MPETGAALAAAGALISDLTSHHQAMRHTTSECLRFRGRQRGARRGSRRAAARSSRWPGASAEFVAIDWTTEARYPDQAWEIEVPLRDPGSSAATTSTASSPISIDAHKEIFAVSDPHSPIETIGWSATIRCRVGSPRAGRMRSRPGRGELSRRPARLLSARPVGRDAAVRRFEALPPDVVVKGPAIVEFGFTSVVIDPGASARRDATRSLVIDVGA